MAQYFPELDKYYKNWGKEGLAIKKETMKGESGEWGDKETERGLEYEEFVRRVTPTAVAAYVNKTD